MAEIKRINANWIAVIPFAFSRQGSPEVHFDNGHQWWGETTEGTRTLIDMAKAQGFEVMIKPHVWMRGGWIGEYDLKDSSEWVNWASEYERYIVNYARLAEEQNVGLLCVGTELKMSATKYPEIWSEIIRKVRQVYSGKLTYAANWDCYQDISFWDELDYIGVDAYFPLVHKDDPTEGEIEQAWIPLKVELKSFSEKHKKPILFTEYGYQSAKGAVGNHWEVVKDTVNINLELQARAYQCLFKALDKEEWYAGGFFWKWHLMDRPGRNRLMDFTPQNKPAEKVIAKYYGQF